MMVQIRNILLVIVILVLSACSNNQPNQKMAVIEIPGLVELAEVLMNNDPDKSLEVIENAYQQACIINNHRLMSEALIIKGQLLTVFGDNDGALSLFNQALLPPIQNDAEIMCKVLFESGRIYYIKGEYHQALEMFIAVRDLARENKFSDMENKAIYYIGKYYHTTGKFAQSMELYEIALAAEPGETILRANILLSLGKALLNEGRTTEAIQLYQDAFNISKKSGNLLIIADAYNHLGSVYDMLEQYNLSISYHQQALSLRITMKSPADMAKSYNNLGEAYFNNNQTDSAAVNFSKSLEKSIQADYKKGMVKALTNLGRLPYSETESNSHLHKALNLSSKAGYDAGMANANLQIAKQHYATNKTVKAIEHYYASLEKALKSRLTELLPQIHHGLYLCYLNQNNPVLALEHLNLYAELEKARLETQNHRQMSELFILFESEKKEKLNQILIAENATKEIAIKRKNIIIGVFFASFVFLAVIISLFYWQLNHKRLAIQEQKRLNHELEKANQEKDKLMSIIAHELRNPLYWFQNLTQYLSTRFHDMPPEKLEKSLLSLDESAKNTFHLMNNLLYWSRSRLNRITIKPDITNLKSLVKSSTQIFTSIIKQKQIELKIDINTNYHLNIDPDLMSCVFRNLVSNAIKFTPQNGKIMIEASLINDNIMISVTDNGIGISKQLQNDFQNNNINFSEKGLLDENGSGFGLKLCKEFIELSGGNLNIDSGFNNGTRFWFSLPYTILESEKTNPQMISDSVAYGVQIVVQR